MIYLQVQAPDSLPNSSHLPEKHPSPPSDRRRWLKVSGAIFTTLAIIGLVAGLQVIAQASLIQALGGESVDVGSYIGSYPDSPISSCDDMTSKEVWHKFSMVNIPVITNLQFAQAKGIDVVWDLVIGQGGRFLHAWVLCSYVLPDAITRILEFYTLRFPALLDLLLSPVSASSLWSMVRSIWTGRKFSWRVFWILFGSFYVISFTLLYPTLWDAATGYVNPTTPVYGVPDGSLQDPFADTIQFCFSLEPDRVPAGTKPVILGPTLKEVAVHQEALKKSVNDTTVKPPAPMQVSQEFQDILNYAIMIRLVQNALRAPSINTQKNWSQPLDASQIGDRGNASFRWMLYPQTINAVQLCGADQSDCRNGTWSYPWGLQSNLQRPQLFAQPFEDDDQYHHSYSPQSLVPDIFFDLNYPNLDSPRAIRSINMKLANISTQNPYYCLGNPSLTACTMPLAKSPLPYTSVLHLAGTAHDIAAPALNLTTNCYDAPYASPACLCYNGQPLKDEFPSSANMGCLSSQDNFFWGFAYVTLLLGMSLELLWVLVCLGLWTDAQFNSVMVRRGRRAAGRLRAVLDIAASVNADLGRRTAGYKEGELIKVLKEKRPVGHEMGVESDVGVGEHEVDEAIGKRMRVGILARRRRWGEER